MDFEKAIKSHSQWRDAFLHYIKNSKGDINIDLLEKHLNVNAGLLNKVLAMFGATGVSLNANFIGEIHNCTLGQWIDDVSELFKTNKDFVKLVKLHNKFHEISSQIITHIENNEREALLELVRQDSEFHKLSNDIEIEILRIQRLIEAN